MFGEVFPRFLFLGLSRDSSFSGFSRFLKAMARGSKRTKPVSLDKTS